MTRNPNDIAQTIINLINSNPRTPSPEAIAAVLEARKALAAPSAAREAYPASEWCRALDEYLDASNRATSDDERAPGTCVWRLSCK